jgi:hypothetical protein
VSFVDRGVRVSVDERRDFHPREHVAPRTIYPDGCLLWVKCSASVVRDAVIEPFRAVALGSLVVPLRPYKITERQSGRAGQPDRLLAGEVAQIAGPITGEPDLAWFNLKSSASTELGGIRG